jgi:hypothetical protein
MIAVNQHGLLNMTNVAPGSPCRRAEDLVAETFLVAWSARRA